MGQAKKFLFRDVHRQKKGFFVDRQKIERSGYTTFVSEAFNLHFIMFIGGSLINMTVRRFVLLLREEPAVGGM